MNKHIKQLKKEKMSFKKYLTKEEHLIIKKYPRLFAYCRVNDISLSTINRLWYKIRKTKELNKTQFQVWVVAITRSIENNHTFKKGSIGEHYNNIFIKNGINFSKGEK